MSKVSVSQEGKKKMSSLAGRGKNTIGRIYTWAPTADWQETRFRLPQCSQVLPDSLNEEAAAPHTNQEAAQIYTINNKQNTQAFFSKIKHFPYCYPYFTTAVPFLKLFAFLLPGFPLHFYI